MIGPRTPSPLSPLEARALYRWERSQAIGRGADISTPINHDWPDQWEWETRERRNKGQRPMRRSTPSGAVRRWPRVVKVAAR